MQYAGDVLSMDNNEQPTVPWAAEEAGQGQPTWPQPVVVPPNGEMPTWPQPVVVPTEGEAGKRPRKGISRRKLAIGLAAAGVAAASGGVALQQIIQRGGLGSILHGPITSGQQAGHLLRRAGFGATPDELASYTSLGFAGAVDRLLNYHQVSDDAMENRLKALNLDLTNPANQQRWWLLRMAWTQRPLLEKMTLFWHGVLTSSFRKVGGKNGYMRMVVQNQFLRDHAFDTYDNILLGITADPAMLFYLDLTKSRKNAPNENYARELMELFTLGLGHYTQQDVFEGAAALTGWHVRGLSSRYVPGDHNDLTKRYLGQTGNFDYKDVTRILTNHPAA